MLRRWIKRKKNSPWRCRKLAAIEGNKQPSISWENQFISEAPGDRGEEKEEVRVRIPCVGWVWSMVSYSNFLAISFFKWTDELKLRLTHLRRCGSFWKQIIWFDGNRHNPNSSQKLLSAEGEPSSATWVVGGIPSPLIFSQVDWKSENIWERSV